MTDEEFIKSVETCTISHEDFGHPQHIRLGWLYVTQNSLTDAINMCCKSLKRLSGHHGARHKYHETITWIYMLLIADRQARNHSDDFESFRRENTDLFTAKPPLHEHYYSKDIIECDLARAQFVMPNLNAINLL